MKNTDYQDAQKKERLANMVISPEDKAKYLAQVKGLSNTRARRLAHNFAAHVLGFYSTEGMKKFYTLNTNGN